MRSSEYPSHDVGCFAVERSIDALLWPVYERRHVLKGTGIKESWCLWLLEWHSLSIPQTVSRISASNGPTSFLLLGPK